MGEKVEFGKLPPVKCWCLMGNFGIWWEFCLFVHKNTNIEKNWPALWEISLPQPCGGGGRKGRRMNLFIHPSDRYNILETLIIIRDQ